MHLITGGNTGIGYETALDLAKRGATIIMGCRNIKKANDAALKIRYIQINRLYSIYRTHANKGRSCDMKSQKTIF